jgi:hypothetical protein
VLAGAHPGECPFQGEFCPVAPETAMYPGASLPILTPNNQNINMKLQTTKVIYWTGAILTSLWFGTSGFCEITRNPLVWNITLALHYPPYFIYVLGIFKLAGIAVLLIPGKLLRLKEWVFAGVFFDILFAFSSKLAVFGFAATIDAIVAFTMVSVTYLTFRKLYPATYLPSR